MSRMYTITATPTLPTILDGQADTVQLPGYELWMTYIENIHILPTRIDPQDMVSAVQASLSSYPHAAGKLYRDPTNGRYEILLTNTPIPFEVEEASCVDLEPDAWVVQSDLRRYLRTRGESPGRYTVGVNLSDPHSDSDHSLLLFKLTLTPLNTVIGVSWHHTLGDAAVLSRFMGLVSQRFAGDNRPPSPLPVFAKPQFPRLEPTLLQQYSPLMPHVAHTYTGDELGEMYAERRHNLSSIAFRISVAQLRALRDRVRGLSPESERVSSQDCLTAYVITVLNRFLGTPISRVNIAASFRNITISLSPIPRKDFMGNAILIIPCTLDTSMSGLHQIAGALRRSILKGREPTFVENYMSVASELMLQAADDGRSMFFAPVSGQASVNSNLAIDWHSAHFGFPGQVRFHTSGINERYIRVFHANLNYDSSSEGARFMEVCFAVDKTISQNVEAILCSGLTSYVSRRKQLRKLDPFQRPASREYIRTSRVTEKGLTWTYQGISDLDTRTQNEGSAQIMNSTLQKLVEQWLAQDPNPETRAEIEALVEAGEYGELEKRMSPRIEFGTAGLRGRMQAGWARMNDLIIIQASQGLCAYVLENVRDARLRGVVVGHDHRHHSEKWARITAAVFINNQCPVYFHDGVVHTPLVPFTVKEKRAACGVMITASHNPKQDNGYKVYWENAVQIIEPHDKGISTSIRLHQEPHRIDWDSLAESPLLRKFDESAYLEYIASLCHYRLANAKTTLKFVNTSMHGVSNSVMTRAFALFGLPKFTPVSAQQWPDPDFPTVKFPNPEEKGALDLAIITANEASADYILAQDPDSDRFAAAERGGDGQWIQFTGDQLGALFASACLDKYKKSGKALDKLAMVASTVSSKMIEAMAETEGFKFAECLTGFKYIGNTGLTLEKDGFEVPFGYEEAIGFMFGSELRDKDGVAASVVFAEFAASLQSQGKSASSHLKELYAKYGFFQTSNSYFICTEPHIIDAIFARIRNFDGTGTSTAPNYPKTIAGLTVTSVRDLTVGFDSSNPPTYKPTLPLSSGHMIQFRAASEVDGTKITLTTRTSGTEPKIKYYLEGSGKDAAVVARLLPQVVQELSDVWMEADKHDLVKS